MMIVHALSCLGLVMTVQAWHRDVYKYDALQKSHEWKELIPTPSRKRTVGILGFGHLGT